jgi:hypothetical protein
LFQDREFETNQRSAVAEPKRWKAGYYHEALLGWEEMDLVFGIMDAIPDLVPARRRQPPRAAQLVNFRPTLHALLVRNRFWIVLRRLGARDAVAYISPRLLLWLIRSIRYGYLKYYLRGIADLGRRLPEIHRDRRPISAETRMRMRRIRGKGWRQSQESDP